MSVTIYYNPACGTARNTLALIRDAGIEPEIIEYLKTPPSRAELQDLMARAGLTPRQLLRDKEKIAVDLDLNNPARTDTEILDAMLAHPILMNRPIVVTPRGVKLCRPAELVLELLPQA
jgi:arsenate reductase (glutaredoxin)